MAEFQHWPAAKSIVVNGEPYCFGAIAEGEFVRFMNGCLMGATPAAPAHDHDEAYEPKNANIQAHVSAAHAPSNAQKNSDITKAEIEQKLTGEISSHSHAAGASSGGPTIKAGTVNLSAGGSANVSFVSPFPAGTTVIVSLTAQINNADTSCTYSAHTISVNGFTARGAGNPAGLVGWIATAAANS